MSEIALILAPRPPFRLDLTVWVLRRRPDNAVDRWDGDAYRRVLLLGGRPAALEVRQRGAPDAPRLDVVARGDGLGDDDRDAIARALDRLLGLSVDLDDYYRLAAGDGRLADLAARFRGMKPTRYLSGFECLASAIACQQVTLTFGLRVLNRLAEAYGPRTPEGVGFPAPETLARLEPEALLPLGFSRAKARATIEIARQVADGRLDLDALEPLPDAEVVARLQALWGVGRWTAEYYLLRGLGRLHVFPGDDVGGRNNLRRWLGLPGRLDYASARAALAPWARWAGLIYFHVLLARLEETGALAAPGGPA